MTFMIIMSNISSICGIRTARRKYSALNWPPLDARSQRLVLSQCVPNLSNLDFDELSRYGFWQNAEGEKLYVLTGNAGNRRFHADILCQVIARPLPTGSILQVNKNLYCTSPALTALLYARKHSFEETFMLLMELLGAYTLPADATLRIERGETWPDTEPEASVTNSETADEHLSDEEVLSDGESQTVNDAEATIEKAIVEQVHNRCEPAATLQDLRMLARWATSKADRTFRQAVNLVAAGSRSPAESVQYAMLGLPFWRGGFNCLSLPGGIKLNYKIVFDTKVANIASGIPYAVCDTYIPAAKIDYEYNGIGHELENARIHDANRNNGLQGMGIRVIVVNRNQLRDIPAIESMAMLAYRLAGVQFRYRVTGYRKLQERLLNDLRMAVGMPPA